MWAVTLVFPTRRLSWCGFIRKQVSYKDEVLFKEKEKNDPEWTEKHKKFIEKRKSFEQREYPEEPIKEEEEKEIKE